MQILEQVILSRDCRG